MYTEYNRPSMRRAYPPSARAEADNALRGRLIKALRKRVRNGLPLYQVERPRNKTRPFIGKGGGIIGNWGMGFNKS